MSGNEFFKERKALLTVFIASMMLSIFASVSIFYLILYYSSMNVIMKVIFSLMLLFGESLVLGILGIGALVIIISGNSSSNMKDIFSRLFGNANSTVIDISIDDNSIKKDESKYIDDNNNNSKDITVK